MIRKVLPAVAMLSLSLAALSPAHAGLFDDDEARRAILDLRSQIKSTGDTDRDRADALEKRLTKLQFDSAQQIDGLNQEIARLRGVIETLQRDVADQQRKQRDFYADIDSRLKRTEPQQVTIDGQQFSVDQEQIKAYNAAFEAFRQSQFPRAADGFSGFLSRYPDSPYTGLATFWLGNAQFATRDFAKAIDTHRTFIKAFPDSPRVPDALLNIGNSQVELADKKNARTTFMAITIKYPDSPAAASAKDRLATLKP
ncbi:tol-pal system protein YbgF [Derxia gummosa]|uniref:Cell division coordinator CpoB n=1 Tax=Derxia gummosa DSM 723 TaxID=1121388 RepID=A0A8B6X5H8_9BURK|nr:tol-pal system protein YbgF [Derxia gummosa]